MSFLLFICLFIKVTVKGFETPGKCIHFSNSTAVLLNNTCAAAVNYNYFLPKRYTKEQYDELVLVKLNHVKFKFLPASCQAALVRYVCSTAYLKCYRNINLNNTATYNNRLYYPYKILVPFERPCMDVCTDVERKCSETIYKLFSEFPACNTTFDYTNGIAPQIKVKRYDSSNNSSQCFRAKLITVAESAEANIGYKKGPCAGISNKLIYAPPGNKIKPYFSVMQSPYLMQTLVDREVQVIFNRLPLFLSKDCSLALKKYICSLTHITAKNMHLGYEFKKFGFDATQLKFIENRYNLTNAVVTLPQYATHKVCTDYSQTCAAFIKLANMPQLVPNCSTTTTSENSTLFIFPKHNQTVVPLPLNVSGEKFVVPLFVSPYVYDASIDANYVYTTKCPTGFVVPEDTSIKNIVYISGTGCALACPSPLLTDKLYKEFNREAKLVTIVGIVLALILLCTYFVCYKNDSNAYLMIIFSVLSFCCSASTLAANLLPRKQQFCSSNASFLTLEHSSGYSKCVAQAVISFYCISGCCATWLMKTIDMFLKVFFHMNDITYFSVAVHIFVIFLLPIIPTAIIGRQGRFGANNGVPWCFAHGDSVIHAFTIPMLIITAIGTCLTNASIVKLAYLYCNSIRVKIDSYIIVTVTFNACMIIVWFSLVFAAFKNKAKKPSYTSSTETWIKCYFSNYGDGTSDLKKICGELPDKHPSFNELKWIMFCLSGQLIIVTVSYLVCSLIRATFVYTSNKKKCNKIQPISNIVPMEVSVFIVADKKQKNDNVSTVEVFDSNNLHNTEKENNISQVTKVVAS